MNSKEFSLKIETMARMKKCEYFDAILIFCEENDVDPSTVGNLISKSLKEKLRVEAVNNRLLKNSNNAPKGKLPL